MRYLDVQRQATHQCRAISLAPVLFDKKVSYRKQIARQHSCQKIGHIQGRE